MDDGFILKIRRNIYQSSKKREKQIAASRDKVKKEQEDIVKIPITQTLYDYFMNATTRGGCENAVVNKDNKRLHDKVMELLDDLEKEINEKTQNDKKASYDAGKILAGALGVCSLANTILETMDKVTAEKE